MPKQLFQKMAAQGKAQLCGTDLVLMEQPDPNAVLLNGEKLGKVVADTAARLQSQVAIQMMDLTLEKNLLLTILGVPEAEFNRFQFQQCPTPAQVALLAKGLQGPLTARLKALVGSIEYIRKKTKLIPTGLVIGPFSLMTKMMPDPITPIFMAGQGATAAEDETVKTAETILEMCTQVVLRSVKAQIAAGVKAIVVCEPAASTTYMSPRQLKKSPRIFEQFVLEPNRRLNALLVDNGVENIFHDCGELTDEMILAFCRELTPVVFSVGSPVDAAHAAAIMPESTILMGNIASKNFHSDGFTVEQVAQDVAKLRAAVKATGHPFLLGPECYILAVKGREAEIAAKIRVLLGN